MNPKRKNNIERNDADVLSTNAKINARRSS